MPRTTYYPPRGEVLPVALFQAPDGRPMQANLVEIRIVRPEGTEVIPPRTVIDGNSSPLWPKEGRRAAWPHDIRFRYARGLLAANRAFLPGHEGVGWPGANPGWAILAGAHPFPVCLHPPQTPYPIRVEMAQKGRGSVDSAGKHQSHGCRLENG